MVNIPLKPWKKPGNELLKELDVIQDVGLSKQQVEERLAKFGHNELPEEEGNFINFMKPTLRIRLGRNLKSIWAFFFSHFSY